MPDPSMAAVVNASARLGSAMIASRNGPIWHPKVGGREERRHVYTRFQEAVVTYVVQVWDSHVSPDAMRLDLLQRKPYVDALMAATIELAQALYEVQLVGHPGPINAADAVRQAVRDSFCASIGRSGSLTGAEIELYGHAMREYIIACRRDLGYQASWWQVWRVDWWKQRWMQLRRCKAVVPRPPDAALEHALLAAGAQPHAAILGAGMAANTVPGTVISSVHQVDRTTNP